MSAVRGPRRRISSVLPLAAILAIAWGALAFGAVYRWAYVPLAIVCTMIGAVGLLAEWRRGPAIGALSSALGVVALAAAIQLIPLSPALLARVSPATDVFLRSYQFSYYVDHSLAQADQETPAGTRAMTHPISIAPEKTILGLALLTAFTIFLAGLIRVLSARGAAAVVRPLVIFAVAMAIFAIGQATLLADREGVVREVYGFWKPRYGGMPFGPFINRNHFAGWTIMVLPLSIASVFAAWEQPTTMAGSGLRGRMSWWSTPRAAEMLLMALASGVTALALLMTQSRSGLAAFAVAALLFGWVLIRRQTSNRARVLAAALVATFVIGALAWAGIDRVSQRLFSIRSEAASPIGRLRAWSDTAAIIRDFPIAGSGLDTYGTAMMVYQTGDRRLHYQEAHNDYLQIVAEGGLLVGVPVLIAVVIFVRDIRRRFKEAPKEGTTYWLRVGAVVGLISIAVQSLVDFSLQLPGNAALFVVIAATALHRSPHLIAMHEPSAARAAR